MTSLFELLVWHRNTVLFYHGESSKPSTAPQSKNTQRTHNELMPGMLHNHQSATTCVEKHSLHSVPRNVCTHLLLSQVLATPKQPYSWACRDASMTSVTTFAIHKKGFQQKPEPSVCLKILTTLGSTQNPQSTKS